jgi:hypothetical protein
VKTENIQTWPDYSLVYCIVHVCYRISDFHSYLKQNITHWDQCMQKMHLKFLTLHTKYKLDTGIYINIVCI